MKLTVLNVAYPLAPVSPDAVGGAEQVLAQLDRGLTRAGHHSIVLGCAGSHVAGTLVATPRYEGALTDAVRAEAWRQYRATLAEILGRVPVDLVHMHGVDFLHYLPPAGVPVLVTLHLPPSWYPPEVFHLTRPQTQLVCVSASQARDCPPAANLLPPIENGVAEADDPHPLHLAKRTHVMAMGRISPEKGFHVALDAARQAGVPLLLAGELFSFMEHVNYYEREIRPRLDRQRKFIGPIGGLRKRQLLSTGRCLLAPSLVAETSSLAAMEALAHGTPVVARPVGALVELIEPGVTGYFAEDAKDMAALIPKAARLDPEACRAAARQRFSQARMLYEYFQYYFTLAAAGDQARATELHEPPLEKWHVA